MIMGQCKRCGRVMEYKKARYCEGCKLYYFKLVNDYIKEHPGILAIDACKKLSIDKALMEEFIDEDSFNLNSENKKTNLINNNNQKDDLEKKRVELEAALKLQSLISGDKKALDEQQKISKGATMHFLKTEHKKR